MSRISKIYEETNSLTWTTSPDKFALHCKKAEAAYSRKTEHTFTPIDLDETETAVSLGDTVLSVARSVTYCVQGIFKKLAIPKKAIQSLEETKFFTIASFPFAFIEIAQDTKTLFCSDKSGWDRAEEFADTSMNILSNISSLVEGAGMVIEATIAAASLTGRIVAVADAFGVVSTIIGLVSFIIDTKALYQSVAGFLRLKEMKVTEIKPDVKSAFSQHLAFTIGARTLNLLVTAVYFASFVVFATVGGPAGWALVAAGGLLILTVKVIEWYADYALHKRLEAAYSAQAA